MARWGNIALVNTHGELFHAASDAELPVFYGPGDGVKEVAEHYGSFNELIKPIGLKVKEMTLTPRRSWQLTTNTGTVIALGRDEMDMRLNRFVGVYAKTLGSVKGNLTYVDLRYPNGFAVRNLAAVAAAMPKVAKPSSDANKPVKDKAKVNKDKAAPKKAKA